MHNIQGWDNRHCLYKYSSTYRVVCLIVLFYLPQHVSSTCFNSLTTKKPVLFFFLKDYYYEFAFYITGKGCTTKDWVLTLSRRSVLTAPSFTTRPAIWQTEKLRRQKCIFWTPADSICKSLYYLIMTIYCGILKQRYMDVRDVYTNYYWYVRSRWL